MHEQLTPRVERLTEKNYLFTADQDLNFSQTKCWTGSQGNSGEAGDKILVTPNGDDHQMESSDHRS